MENPHENLTRNQKLVYTLLLQEARPLKAYDILDRLKDAGIRAPMTVYRALNELENYGLITRIDDGRAYLAIDRLEDGTDLIVYFVCQQCGRAKTHKSPKIRDLITRIRSIADDIDFALSPGRAEVYGVCADCRTGPVSA